MTQTSATYADIQFDEAGLDKTAVAFIGEKPSGAVGTQDLSGFGYTYRHDWGTRNGWWTLNLTSADFTADTRVFVSASEGPTASGGKFIGSARYLIHNVAPENGVVSIRIFIDWPSPIGLVVDYLIVHP